MIFFVITTIINNKAKLRIEFETNDFDLNNDFIFDDFWIKYDRLIMNSNVRKVLALSTHDYEEYPIVDILDYYPKKINNGE